MPTLKPIIGLIGHKRSGKDSLAQFLVASHGYTRVALADPLKQAALALDPIVYVDDAFYHPVRLSEVVEREGWERAKDTYPEVRRILQSFGEAIRQLEPSFWLDRALDKLGNIDGPVVVTDVRFRNEAEALHGLLDATLVRILRGDADISAALDTHVSEHELDDYPTDLIVDNNGPFAYLESAAQGVAAAAAAHERVVLMNAMEDIFG